MANKQYNFQSQDKFTKNATEDITTWLKEYYTVILNVENHKGWQAKDVDLLAFYKDEDKQLQRLKLEIKADSYDKSPNYFAETISNCNKNTTGCWFQTKSDFILYYFPNIRELHVIPTEEAQTYVREHIQNFKVRRTSTGSKSGQVYYESEGVLVPRKELKKHIDIKIFKI